MSQAPTVPFAAVASAQELELLAEVRVGGGNASEIARRILRRLPAEPGRRSYAACESTGVISSYFIIHPSNKGASNKDCSLCSLF